MERRIDDLAAVLARVEDLRQRREALDPLAASAPLFTSAPVRLSLQLRWQRQLERLGLRPFRSGHSQSSAAREVRDLEVRTGRLTAVHGRAHVEIEVLPPLPDARLEAVREHLDGVDDDRTALRDALCDAMATWSGVLLPAPRTIRGRCTCSEFALICEHARAVLLAFGERLDAEPELLVRLRGLERLDVRPGPLAAEKQRLTGDLAAIFGIDLETAGADEAAAQAPADPVPPPIPPAQQAEVGREHLRVLGLSSRTIDAWRRQGVLGPTDRPDVYVRTPEANRRISRHLAR